MQGGVADAHGHALWGPGARIAGDNINVVRYCASEGRIKRPHIQELLEGPLGDSAIRGWPLELDGGAKRGRKRRQMRRRRSV